VLSDVTLFTPLRIVVLVYSNVRERSPNGRRESKGKKSRERQKSARRVPASRKLCFKREPERQRDGVVVSRQ
jgi:hypothetical protein